MLIFKLVETLLVQGITQVETANLDVSPKPGARKMEMVCRGREREIGDRRRTVETLRLGNRDRMLLHLMIARLDFGNKTNLWP